MPLNFSIFDRAIKAIDEGINTFTSMPGSSKALFFSMLEERAVLLCHSESSADEIYSDVVFWARALGAEEPLLIPPVGDPRRLKNLGDVYSKGRSKIITSVEAAVSPVWRLNEFPSLRFLKNSAADRYAVVETFEKFGYVTVPLVSTQGEMSSRGAILDVFPPEEEFPVRIEFFGDEIESLRYFDTDTQRTIKEVEEMSIGPAAEPEEGPKLVNILEDFTLILNEPDDIKRHFPDFIQEIRDRKTLYFTSLSLEGEGFNFDIKGVSGMGLLPQERENVEDFVKRVKELQREYFLLIICSSEGQAKRLKELFIEGKTEVLILPGSSAVNFTESPVITTGEVSRGFIFDNNIVLTGKDIFGDRPRFRPVKKSRVSKLISSVEDFKEGEYLVHTKHGIGKFTGLKRQRVEDYEGDFIIIEYLGGDRLYVPLERINSVQKYHAPEGVKPRIDKLGGKTWQRTKQRVRRRIIDMTEKLLSLYARRSQISGYAFSGDSELHREFDGFFPYEETPDQIISTNEIKKDMESAYPMDRLLCGDVGYGKTEVIMRACFKAVYDSKQAAVLVPTTILAEQHFNTFISRFSAFPVKIDFLSRFKSRAEQRKTLKALAEGSIDIVIGTHRLLAKDVNFYNLGLLVVDEEHKFGVTHKEKIKELKSNIDILSLSATPIPRTLHMALSGIRAMSVIETPPEDRLAVKSFVARFASGLIREALQKEFDREGQAFFVHNRIHNIYNMADFLRGLIPEARVAVAHGQMRERELEQVMMSFFRKEVDILVSTAIIGAGIDIPTANTIIINHADKFGLADLYQLRGRVGRSNVRAYAYFLVAGEEIITSEAKRKLNAIQELSYLGAGFRLAMKDLEIRGAGNLLGAEQSGHIEAVGFDLYVEMLEQAVAELKGEKIAPGIEPVLDLKVAAFIPEEYIENPDIRLSIYRKIASAKSSNSLKELMEELKDRFGEPPAETKRLLEIMELKLLAKSLLITRIQDVAGKIRIIFAAESPVAPERLLQLVRDRERYLKFLPSGGIELDMKMEVWDGIFKELRGVMSILGPLTIEIGKAVSYPEASGRQISKKSKCKNHPDYSGQN